MNYKVEITLRDGRSSVSAFAEYWLAKAYARAIEEDAAVRNIYLWEDLGHGFELTQKLK